VTVAEEETGEAAFDPCAESLPSAVIEAVVEVKDGPISSHHRAGRQRAKDPPQLPGAGARRANRRLMQLWTNP
jgi:hypothetical protein